MESIIPVTHASTIMEYREHDDHELICAIQPGKHQAVFTHTLPMI